MYFITPNHEKVFIIGYLDDYSRYVVSLDLFHRQTVGNTIGLLKKVCGDYTFPKEILTDGGRQLAVCRSLRPLPMEKWNGSGGRFGRSFSKRRRSAVPMSSVSSWRSMSGTTETFHSGRTAECFNLFPLRTPGGSGAAALGTTEEAPGRHDGR